MTERTTIEISTENWRWLNGLKRPGESFNDVLDRLRGEHEGTTPATSLDPSERAETLPDDLDLPGSGDTLERRRAAIARLYNHLQEQGTASKSDFLELIDADEVGYSSAESFWSNCVKGRNSLSALPGVEAPNEGSRTWRHTE